MGLTLGSRGLAEYVVQICEIVSFPFSSKVNHVPSFYSVLREQFTLPTKFFLP